MGTQIRKMPMILQRNRKKRKERKRQSKNQNMNSLNSAQPVTEICRDADPTPCYQKMLMPQNALKGEKEKKKIISARSK